MIKIIITQASEVAKLKALGVVDLPPRRWRWDDTTAPFTRRDYGYQHNTHKSGKMR